MEWILVFKLCFLVSGDCSPNMQSTLHFDTYTKCLRHGLVQATNIIDNLDEKEQNLNPTFSIYCNPIKNVQKKPTKIS